MLPPSFAILLTSLDAARRQVCWNPFHYLNGLQQQSSQRSCTAKAFHRTAGTAAFLTPQLCQGPKWLHPSSSVTSEWGSDVAKGNMLRDTASGNKKQPFEMSSATRSPLNHPCQSSKPKLFGQTLPARHQSYLCFSPASPAQSMAKRS